MTPPFPQLMQELEILDVLDDHKLIDWLERTFRAAAEQGIEIPERHRIAVRVGGARQIWLTEELYIPMPPNEERGNPELAAWLIDYATHLLMRDLSGEPLLHLIYHQFASFARTYLGR